MVVNIELAEPNDCATPEPGVRSESAGMAWESPSAAAMFSESRLVITFNFYMDFCQREANLLNIE
jgi:hypothetical protein